MSPLELDGFLTGVVVTPQGPRMDRPALGDNEPIFGTTPRSTPSSARRSFTTIPLSATSTAASSGWRSIASSIIGRCSSRETKSRATTPCARGSRLLEGDGAGAGDLEQARRGRAHKDHHRTVRQLLRSRVTLQMRPPATSMILLDADAELIPRMVLALRKLTRIREAAGRPAPLFRRRKLGRNDPCPCRSGKKYKRCCARA